MANTYAILALKRKRATLLGDIMLAREAVDRLLEDLACLDATMLLFDTTIDPASIKPVVRRLRDTTFQYGELIRVVREVFRKAEAPLTIPEIARRVADEKGMDVSTKPAFTRLRDKVQRAIWGAHEGLTVQPDARGRRYTDEALWSG